MPSDAAILRSPETRAAAAGHHQVGPVVGEDLQQADRVAAGVEDDAVVGDLDLEQAGHVDQAQRQLSGPAEDACLVAGLEGDLADRCRALHPHGALRGERERELVRGVEHVRVDGASLGVEQHAQRRAGHAQDQ